MEDEDDNDGDGGAGEEDGNVLREDDREMGEAGVLEDIVENAEERDDEVGDDVGFRFLSRCSADPRRCWVTGDPWDCASESFPSFVGCRGTAGRV